MNRLKTILVFSIIAIVFTVLFLSVDRWKAEIIGGGDSWGYYCYLPATFIHGDLDSLHRTIENRREYHPGWGRSDNSIGTTIAYEVTPGTFVNKYTYGVALFLLPAFLIAHALALIGGLPADGHSPVYIICASISGFVYVFLGLILMYRILRRYVSSTASHFTVLSIGLGSLIFYLGLQRPIMSHNILFALYPALVLLSLNYREAPSLLKGFFIGCLVGAISIIRPVEIIVVLIPLLVGFQSFKLSSIKEHLFFHLNNWPKLVAAVLGGFIMCVPQLLYWKYTSGSWLYYSYHGEGFDFLDPQIIDGLFGAANGLFPYSPIIILSIFGFYCLFKQKNPLALGIVIVCILHTYITYCWWATNYFGAMGARPMSQLFPLLAIAMAYVFHWLLKKNVLTKILALIFLLGSIAHMSMLIYQEHKGIIYPAYSNYAHYWRMLGKTEADYLDFATYDTNRNQPSPDKLKLVKSLVLNDFNQVDSSILYVDTVNNIQGVIVPPKSTQKELAQVFSVGEQNIQKGQYIYVRARAMKQQVSHDLFQTTYFGVCWHNGAKTYGENTIRVDTKLEENVTHFWGGQNNYWKDVYFYSPVDYRVQDDHKLIVFFWNATDQPIFVDELQIDIYEEK